MTSQTIEKFFTYKLVHDLTGKKKIKDSFLVALELHPEPFMVKSLKCLSSFISQVYSVKPWNCCAEPFRRTH